MSSSLLQLQDLWSEALVRELIKKTQNCGVTWTSSAANTFKATTTVGSDNWEFSVVKTATGNVTSKYGFTAKKNGTSYIEVQDGPLPRTERDSAVKELYEVVEIIVRGLQSKVQEAIQVVQNLTGCNEA